MSSALPPPEPPSHAAPLDEAARRRGRRLAYTSHPLGMIFNSVFTDNLPTLALVFLGASESVVGLHSGLRSGSQLLQLPTLRRVARYSKRRILVGGHIAALVAGAPLLFFGSVAGLDATLAVWIVFTSLVATAAAINVSQTVWFPLLRGYVEPDRIGQFFGLIRTGWHLSLILYFAAATLWLADREGAFGPLFAAAWAFGVLRIALIARLPERDERTGERIRVREAWSLVRTQPLLRTYLVGTIGFGAIKSAALPFVIVMLRREVGFSSAEVIYTTLAVFAGGLVSLYLWGRVVDRVGVEPIFRISSLGLAVLYLSLVFVNEPGALVLLGMVGFFFAHSVFSAGFGVADTRVLFELTPAEAPARTLVITGVIQSALIGPAPIIAGFALDALLERAEAPLEVYHAFFVLAAVAQALAFLPLRVFRNPISATSSGSGRNRYRP